MISGKAPPDSQRRLAKVVEGVGDPCQPLAGRFPGYPPGFLEAIDKAMQVVAKNRLESATDWLDWIAAGEQGQLTAATAEAPPAATGGGSPAAPGLGAANRGFLIGVGAVLVVAGLGWLVLSLI